jgi:threonine aldolase
MREAMARAEVGDDVWEEDPTVRRLEESAARRTGKDAASSSPRAPGQPRLGARPDPAGQEIVLDRDSHILNYEVAARPSSAACRPARADGARLPHRPTRSGTMPPEQHPYPVDRPRMRGEHAQPPRRHLLHPEEIAAVAAAPTRRRAVHLDGARSSTPPWPSAGPWPTFARAVDSVTFCLSKGLAAPVGSVVCGSRDFIASAAPRAEDAGGGMRQVACSPPAGSSPSRPW